MGPTLGNTVGIYGGSYGEGNGFQVQILDLAFDFVPNSLDSGRDEAHAGPKHGCGARLVNGGISPVLTYPVGC